MEAEKNRKEFKILAIDGGGIKGLYSSTILEHFEEKFNCLLSDYFDLLCGTSTGGLIALAASLKIPMINVSKFYQEEGPKIFPKQRIFWLGFSKYKQQIFKFRSHIEMASSGDLGNPPHPVWDIPRRWTCAIHRRAKFIIK